MIAFKDKRIGTVDRKVDVLVLYKTGGRLDSWRSQSSFEQHTLHRSKRWRIVEVGVIEVVEYLFNPVRRRHWARTEVTGRV
jgi:hypothetical protein